MSEQTELIGTGAPVKDQQKSKDEEQVRVKKPRRKVRIRTRRDGVFQIDDKKFKIKKDLSFAQMFKLIVKELKKIRKDTYRRGGAERFNKIFKQQSQNIRKLDPKSEAAEIDANNEELIQATIRFNPDIPEAKIRDVLKKASSPKVFYADLNNFLNQYRKEEREQIERDLLQQMQELERQRDESETRIEEIEREREEKRRELEMRAADKLRTAEEKRRARAEARLIPGAKEVKRMIEEMDKEGIEIVPGLGPGQSYADEPFKSRVERRYKKFKKDQEKKQSGVKGTLTSGAPIPLTATNPQAAPSTDFEQSPDQSGGQSPVWDTDPQTEELEPLESAEDQEATGATGEGRERRNIKEEEQDDGSDTESEASQESRDDGEDRDPLTDGQTEDEMIKWAKNIRGYVGVCTADEILDYSDDLLEDDPKISSNRWGYNFLFVNTIKREQAGKVSGHWVLLVTENDLENGRFTIMYYDPLGDRVTAPIFAALKELVQRQPFLYEFKTNLIATQDGESSLCGFHTITVAKMLEKGVPWREATRFDDSKAQETAEELL